MLHLCIHPGPHTRICRVGERTSLLPPRRQGRVCIGQVQVCIGQVQVYMGQGQVCMGQGQVCMVQGQVHIWGEEVHMVFVVDRKELVVAYKETGLLQETGLRKQQQ